MLCWHIKDFLTQILTVFRLSLKQYISTGSYVLEVSVDSNQTHEETTFIRPSTTVLAHLTRLNLETPVSGSQIEENNRHHIR